jgi:hypothetical protein
MVKICCATMVKDEADIIRQWIEYHGNLFSYENLYIIDNYSTDNTFEICEEYLSKGINLKRRHEYIHKGYYMTEIMNNTTCDFFIPIDIDEFIVYYNKTENVVECSNVVTYLNELKCLHPENALFKMDTILPLRTNDDPILLKQFTHGFMSHQGLNAKSFLQTIPNNIVIDHGNHMPYENHILSDLFIIHYHKRSDIQHKTKIINNVIGLGHKLELDYLKQLGGVSGAHHVQMAIHMLENPSVTNAPPIQMPNNTSISFHNFINVIHPGSN